jgi:nitrate reductase NapE component
MKWISLLLLATITVPSTNWLEWLLQIINGPSGIFS